MYRFMLSRITMIGSLNATKFRTHEVNIQNGYVGGLANVFHSRHDAFQAHNTIKKMIMVIRQYQALHS